MVTRLLQLNIAMEARILAAVVVAYYLTHIALAGSYPYKPETCRSCIPVNCGSPRNPWDLFAGRAFGGSNSTRGRYPWHAIVYADGVPIGGGALISCNLVLTTAYLVQDYTTSQLEVKLGKSNLNVVSSTERSYKVYDKVLHPRWDQDVDLYSFDLALLQLDSEIDFATTNGYINAVCLPDKRTDTQGLLTLTGFGYDDSGRANAIMQEVNIKKQPQDECPLFRHKPYAFCGVGRNAGICTGDRGSPVVQLGPSGQFTLVGVANDYQCTPGFPDVYTQISYFLQFICNVPTGF